MIHEQLWAKIDAAIGTWQGLYPCTTDSTANPITHSFNGHIPLYTFKIHILTKTWTL
jgi:hypothetical protein